MYTEESVIDKIEILEDGQIQIRRADRVLKDGVKIAETYHRHVITPDQDIKDEDERVQAVANAVWTSQIKEEFLKYDKFR